MLVYDAPTAPTQTAAPLQRCVDLHHDPQHRAVPADLRFWTCLYSTVIVWYVDLSLFSPVTLTARYLVYGHVELSSYSHVIIALKQSSRQPTDYKEAHQTYKHSLDYGGSSLTLSALFTLSAAFSPSAAPPDAQNPSSRVRSCDTEKKHTPPAF